MTALELLTLVSQSLFGLVFVLFAVRAVRSPTRVRVDATLFLGALALIIVVPRLTQLFGTGQSGVVALVTASLLMAIPFLLLRVAADFVAIPRARLRAAALGLGVSAGLIGLIPLGLPAAVFLVPVLCFGAVAGYAAYEFGRSAVSAGGVMRRRMQSVALGSALLGLAILVIGLTVMAPGAAGPLTSTSQVLALASALAYAAGFTPPAALRRYWREPELRRYLLRSAELTHARSMADALRELEAIASAATNAHASIGLLGPEGRTLTFPSLISQDGTTLVAPMEGSLSAVVLRARRAQFFGDPAAAAPASVREIRARGVTAVAGAPIHSGTEALGTLMVYVGREPAFLEDDLDLVELLAMQAGLTIEGRRMLERQAALTAEASEARIVAERATQAKTEFLAGMSHELRTPLNAILGFSDLLREQLEEAMTDRQRRYLANIRGAGEHLLALINDILDLSRVEAGHLELKPELVTLDDLAAPIIASTRAAADAAELTFDAETGGSAAVFVDLARTRQVLYNLASNAVKFTPARGRVTLRQWLEGNDLCIEVADTGIGIPEDRHARVFGQFERVNEDRSQATGTGLGLALTKRLVELHRGTIDFESATGEGSTFRVRFPDVAAARHVRGRLLIVEDERRDAELIIALASEQGVPSEVVPSVTAALAAMEREAPLAVVLDLRLPDARGEAVLRALQRQAARVPIAVVSVEDDDGHSVKLGADMHLVKPLDRARLAEWLARVTARSAVPSRIAG